MNQKVELEDPDNAEVICVRSNLTFSALSEVFHKFTFRRNLHCKR
jgi:hypothetical protein